MSSLHQRWWSVRCLALAFLGVLWSAPPARAFGKNGGVGHALHTEITAAALPFLRPYYWVSVREANLAQDEDASEKDLCSHHGCNCQFAASAKFYNRTYRDLIASLTGAPGFRFRASHDHPGTSRTLDAAAWSFGSLLHGVQDFYSHANWVPRAPEGLDLEDRLLDTGRGEWTVLEGYQLLFDDVVVLEGDPPEGVRVRLPTDEAGAVSSAVPIVIDTRHAPTSDPAPVGERSSTVATEEALEAAARTGPGRRFRGLMTAGSLVNEGGRTFYPEQRCPPAGSSCKRDSPEDVCLRHGEGRSHPPDERNFEGEGHLNMDRGGDGEDFAKARHLAKRQTQHEWCRLLNLSRDLDPTFTATGRLLGLWVQDGHTGNIPGTICAREPRRRHTVKVTARLDRRAPDLTYVLTRADFTDSGRTEVGGGQARELQLCADPGDRVIATLVSRDRKGSGTEIVVPDEAKTWSFTDHRGAVPVAYTVSVTRDLCDR